MYGGATQKVLDAKTAAGLTPRLKGSLDNTLLMSLEVPEK